MSDVILSRANYAKLDDKGSPVRIRLNSTAVRVKHQGDPAGAKEVEVTYARGGKVYTVRASHCILACWHVVIPYICEQLPDKQKQALSSAAKVPLLYTNVALRNWKAFQKLGTNAIYAPGQYHSHMNLDLPVSIGGYECSRRPEDPIVMHMMKTPCKPGRPARDQHLIGRMELFNTTFETMERNIREQLARIAGPGGFDPATDITAITVNRWPHGYAYEYNSLWDKFWLEGGETPCEVARQPFGRIAVANADAVQGATSHIPVLLEAGERLNPDDRGSSLATSVQVLQLKSIRRLEVAEFPRTCGSVPRKSSVNLLASDELTLEAGQSLTRQLTRNPRPRTSW